MAKDQITFGRATTAAVIGLVLQLIMTLATGGLGLWARSVTIDTVAMHMLAGLPIWFILAIIFHQHKIERTEALETEQLSRRDREAAAMFDEQADDLDLARRRLDRLYKWGLNIVSGLISLYLLGMGCYLMYRSSWPLPENMRRAPYVNTEFTNSDMTTLTAVSFAIAFVAFIAARWVSGYTKVKEWQLLRGGASYLMGSGAMALLVFIAALWSAFDSGARDMVFLWVGRIGAGVMILVGLEILLTFLLGAYRPRRPGETPRPAFDSRVLGMLTSPESLGKIVSETINYQFGFEISRSWFYKLLGQKMPYLVIFAVVCLMLISSITVVESHQRGVVLKMGRYDRVLGPGPSLKLPWPFESVEKYDVKRVKQIDFTTDPFASTRPENSNDAILWVATSEEENRQEDFYLTAPTLGIDADGAEEGSGTGLAGMEVSVQYRVRLDEEAENPIEAFLNGADDPDKMVRLLTERAVAAYFASHDLDSVLGDERMRAGPTIRAAMQRQIDSMGLGMEIVNVAVTGVRPPLGRVASSFHDVVSADQDAQAAIEDAQKQRIATLSKTAGSVEYAQKIAAAVREFNALSAQYQAASTDEERAELQPALEKAELEAERLLRNARGEAAEVLQDATAYRWDRAISAQAQIVRSRAEFEPYRVAPDYYRIRRYYQTIAEGLKDRRKYVLTAKQAAPPVIQMELKDDATALDTLFDTGD